MPLYAIGGMGAGDVKLMAGVGAWIGPAFTFWAFLSTAMVGGLMGLAMMAASGELARHLAMTQTIGREVLTVRDPVRALRYGRPPQAVDDALPYGIPIAIGTIRYLGWAGFLALNRGSLADRRSGFDAGRTELLHRRPGPRTRRIGECGHERQVVDDAGAGDRLRPGRHAPHPADAVPGAGQAVEEAQDVLVAARDIKEEELLKPDTVKVIRMAKSAVPAARSPRPRTSRSGG